MGEILPSLLRDAGIDSAGVYRPGEVCRLLRISRTTLLNLCGLADHPDTTNKDPRGLPSFKVGSTHRITHDALVEWLNRNQSYERE